MSTSTEAVAVLNQQQALTPQAPASPSSPVAEPISAAQADIALTDNPVHKLPVAQFREQYDLRVKELTAVTAENTELAIQLKDLKPAAEKLEALGGLPYIEQAVDASNTYLAIASIPLDGEGKITRKHFDAGQKFVDKIYEISPPSGEIMELVMNQLYGGKAWDQFADWMFGHKPSDAEVDAVKQFIANGYQLQAAPIAANGNGKYPAFCYDFDGVEIPENVAYVKSQQQALTTAKTQVDTFLKEQNVKSAAQKQQEEQSRTAQETDRQKNYREKAFEPVNNTVLAHFPDAATNPKAQELKDYLEFKAEKIGGENLKLALEAARLNQMGVANGKLAGIQANIRVEIAKLATNWLQAQGAPTIREQLDKVKNADTAIPTGVTTGGIPYRPEREDYPNTLAGDEAWRLAKHTHRATYKDRIPDWYEYIAQTTRPKAGQAA